MANASEAWMRPPGWRVVSTLWLQSSNSRDASTGQFSSPFAAVLTKDAIMVVLVRGSKTLTDWLAGGRQQQQQQQQQWHWQQQQWQWHWQQQCGRRSSDRWSAY
jgi:hypothetical protein